MNAAVADDVMVKSPVKSKRHRPRRQREAHVVLERLEARHLLLHLKGWHRDTALLQLALGARVGEIGGLTPHDIDLRRRRVTIRRRHYRGTIRATKNHRMRTLELPAITVPTLERLIDAAGAVPRIPPLDDREHDADQFLKYWLIQTSTGRPVNYSAYNKALSKACASAEVPRVSSHALRHTYVSWMIDEGHSADKVAFWIGDTPDTVRSATPTCSRNRQRRPQPASMTHCPESPSPHRPGHHLLRASTRPGEMTVAEGVVGRTWTAASS